MHSAAPPRWLSSGAGLSLLVAALLVSGGRGLQTYRHYLELGGDLRLSLDDAGLNLYTQPESSFGRPYRGRSLHYNLATDTCGFGFPFYYRFVRWANGSSQWMITIDLLSLLLITSLSPAVWLGWKLRIICQSERPAFRFSLRMLLLAFVGIGLVMSLRQYSYAQHRLAQRLEARGTRFDWNCTDTPQSGPIELLFGDNHYDDLFGVFFENDTVTAADIDSLQQFPHLIRLQFTGCRVSDEGLRRIAELPYLRELTFTRCDVTPQGIEASAQGKELTRLALIEITGVDVAELNGLERLDIRTAAE